MQRLSRRLFAVLAGYAAFGQSPVYYSAVPAGTAGRKSYAARPAHISCGVDHPRRKEVAKALAIRKPGGSEEGNSLLVTNLEEQKMASGGKLGQKCITGQKIVIALTTRTENNAAIFTTVLLSSPVCM